MGNNWEVRLAAPLRIVKFASMNPTTNARRLRRLQTDEERELWRALRAGRFAGFKFRRQHPQGKYILDFYCPVAKLSVELDGAQHGFPENQQRDQTRAQYLASVGIEELRFWNHQWHTNRDGILLEMWEALHRRTGCVAITRKVQNNRFLPPDPARVISKPPQRHSSPSPPSNGGEGRGEEARGHACLKTTPVPAQRLPSLALPSRSA
jgi:very-short-patch-repair endonuclease